MIDGDRGGDDSVDPTCVGYSEKVKDQDVDEADGKNEGVYSKGGVLRVEKNGV